MLNKQKYAIIVAGGSGKRMGADIPKQFIEVAKLPILMHTLQCFYRYDESIKLILVLPENQHEYWDGLISKFTFEIKHTIVSGGSERFHSVKNGLTEVLPNGLVAVHDGVRPLVSAATIKACFDEAKKTGASIPVIPATESIRKVVGNTNTAVIRSEYYMVQTPQIFASDTLLSAYKQAFSKEFTDDASVVESNGNKITLVDGNPENIKITRPMDLVFAEALLSKNTI